MYGLQTPPSSSSSSSSAPSGATTPVDEVSPVLISFPRQTTISSSHGLSSAGSSSFSLEQAQKHLSYFSFAFPSARVRTESQPIRPRPPKLSLDMTKVKPAPAVPSASVESSPLGAFSPTSSATRHLRSLVDRTGSLDSDQRSRTISHSVTFSGQRELDSESQPNHHAFRTSAFRTLSFNWAARRAPLPSYDVDGGVAENECEEQESFWPPKFKNRGVHQNVPSITRSSSPGSSSSEQQDNSIPVPPSLLHRNTTPIMPPQARKRPTQLPRSSSSSALPNHTHTRSASLPFTGAAAGPRESLSPPPRIMKAGKYARRPSSPRRTLPGFGSSSSISGTSELPTLGGLDPTLAAVEQASRLRTDCICGVCGKNGKDFPRCPRCSIAWCSRDCRVNSGGPNSKHVCTGRRQTLTT